MNMEIFRWGPTFATLCLQHIHRADNGATIFVKLWKVDTDDPHQMSVDTIKAHLGRTQGFDDASSIDLYSDDRKNICVEIYYAYSHQIKKDHKGIEVFVVSGGFSENDEQFDTYFGLNFPREPISKRMLALKVRMFWINCDHLSEDQNLQ